MVFTFWPNFGLMSNNKSTSILETFSFFIKFYKRSVLKGNLKVRKYFIQKCLFFLIGTYHLLNINCFSSNLFYKKTFSNSKGINRTECDICHVTICLPSPLCFYLYSDNNFWLLGDFIVR